MRDGVVSLPRSTILTTLQHRMRRDAATGGNAILVQCGTEIFKVLVHASDQNASQTAQIERLKAKLTERNIEGVE